MKRSRNKIRDWDDVVGFLMDIDARYIVRRNTNTPFLNVRDKQTTKQFYFLDMTTRNVII